MSKSIMPWVYDDGGRNKSGYKGVTGDCVTRAIAIATNKPYKDIYDLINIYAKSERTGKHKKTLSNARIGVHKYTYDKLLKELGWEWVSTMNIGSGCKVHMTQSELPKGKIIVRLSKHLSAVIDGVTHDTHDPSRGGTRCVYGYYRIKSNS